MTDPNRRLAEAINELYRGLRRLPSTPPMSDVEASVLARLRAHGQLRISYLAAEEHVSQPAMTQLVNRLERDGRVARTRDSADRRAVLVSLTQNGRDAFESRIQHRIQSIMGLIANLDQSQRELLYAAAESLSELVDDEKIPSELPADYTPPEN